MSASVYYNRTSDMIELWLNTSYNPIGTKIVVLSREEAKQLRSDLELQLELS